MDDFGIANIIEWVFLIAWIGLIFYLSSGKNSLATTLPFFQRVLQPVLPNSSSAAIRKLFVTVRKIGHLAGYAVLALVASLAFFNASVIFLAHYWYAYSFAVTLVVAVGDETRQHFDPDRDGSIRDVALDCVGGATGIIVAWVIFLR